MKRLAMCIWILGCSAGAWALDPPEMRAVYLTMWDINTQSECDSAIGKILADNINAVFVEVRGRADAYYFPNREDSTYPNNEPRGQYETISPSGFDPLQYFIDKMHNASPRREVHAWCTTFNSWPKSTPPPSPNHVYNAHPEWITENDAGVTFTYTNDAPLDPGIPAVQDHIYNVFMDIVRNYDVDGIHFDYIRLISTNSGYDPVARAQFLAETGFTYTPSSPGPLAAVFRAWRRDQIAQLVQRVHDQTQLEKPWVDVSAFLVNFSGTDSIDYLGQGYNWWVAHNAIDVLHPGCYSETVSGTVSDWDHYISRLAENGNQNSVPIVSAIGDYLLTDPNENATAVTTLRGNTRPPDGFNFFDYGSLYLDSGTPADQHAQNLFNTGGPMDDWANLPSTFVETGEESTPPNAPTGLSVTLVGGVPRISFNRPAAAGDGDLPVHYRLYRDTAASPKLNHDNMAMEWWDLGSTRFSFTFDDVAAPGGTWYYAAVAYDDWNNQAVATTGPVTVAGAEVIVDNGDAGYTKSGSWTAGTYSGTSYGGDYEWASSGGAAATARWTPTIATAGNYEVFVWFVEGANRADNAPYKVSYSGGSTTIPVNQQAGGGGWNSLGTFAFAAGTSGYVELSDNANPSVVVADAARFVLAGTIGTPTPKEPKPAVTPASSSVTEVIVDSSPVSLDYDDIGGTGGWTTSTYGTPLGGSARYYTVPGGGLDKYATWVVDLPRSGRWAIDGYMRAEQGGTVSTGAQYRFVDSGGTVRNVTTTQKPGSGGWTLNVDGVADGSAYHFNKGRVYVTLYGNVTTGEIVFADGLRFRLIVPDNPSGIENWELF